MNLSAGFQQAVDEFILTPRDGVFLSYAPRWKLQPGDKRGHEDCSDLGSVRLETPPGKGRDRCVFKKNSISSSGGLP